MPISKLVVRYNFMVLGLAACNLAEYILKHMKEDCSIRET